MKAAIALFILVFIASSNSRAATASVCTEGELRAAVAEGTRVTFECSGTIVLSNAVEIVRSTVLDGRPNGVSIIGGGRTRLFNVAPGVEFTLINVRLEDGAVVGAPGGRSQESGAVFPPEDVHGGAIAGTNATIILQGCVLTNNSALGGDLYFDPILAIGPIISASAGGAIWLEGGSLKIADSQFLDNRARVPFGSAQLYEAYGHALGGAIAASNSTVTITNSVFRNNSAGTPGGGAIYAVNSPLRAVGTIFEGNVAIGNSAGRFGATPPGAGRGGALMLTNSSGDILSSSFAANTAVGGTTYRTEIEVGQGGAIYSNDELNLSGSTFVGNAAGGEGAGGAVYAGARAKVASSRFIRNEAIGASVTANGAGQAGPGNGFGGAIANFGVISLSGATFISNTASAGVVFYFTTHGSTRLAQGGAIYSAGELAGTNLVVAFNEASGLSETNLAGTGLFLQGGTNTLEYSTVASNRMVLGLGGVTYSFANAVSSSSNGKLTAHASIFAGSATNLIDGPFSDLGYNLSSDASLTAATSRNSIDARVRMRDVSGCGEVMALLHDSPAIDAADPTALPAVDGCAEPRPMGAGPDIGAFEYNRSAAQNSISIHVTGSALRIVSIDDGVRGVILESSGNLRDWQAVLTNAPAAEYTIHLEATRQAEFFRIRVD